jgi:hypothetical protein
MGRKIGLSVLLAGLMLVVSYGNGVAGIEPSPWKPEINKLNAVENGLHSIHERVSRVLATPPDPWTPSPAVQGVVGRLSAIGNQLSLLDGMLISVMDEVLQTSPGQAVPEDMLPALGGVKAASQAVVDSVSAFLTASPPAPVAFIDALTNVKHLSQTLVEDAVSYLNGGACTSDAGCRCIGTSTACGNIQAPSSCLSQVGCTWSGTPPCSGTSTGCGAFVTPGSCTFGGCAWTDTVPGSCIGTATPCSALDSAACDRQGGCGNGICVGGACQ